MLSGFGDKTLYVKTMGKLMPIAGLIFIAGLVSACSATYKQYVLEEPSTKLVNRRLTKAVQQQVDQRHKSAKTIKRYI